MRDPDEFDAFYKDARSRLLLQTFALTGDLTTAKHAVRDAFVLAWHHWRRATRDGDPEAWVRPYAWTYAQRRHTTRIWHREKDLDPGVQATLDALAKLSTDQRKMVLLTVLAHGTLADFAREVGLPREDAERALQTGMAQLAILRDVPTPALRDLFVPLAEVVDDQRLPRATILRRAGANRRRAHTALGVVGAAAILVVSGLAVTDTDGVRPRLDRATDGAAAGPLETSPSDPAAPPPLTEDALLTAQRVGALVPARRWSVASTDDNSAGDGLVLPCQQQRYADPRGTAALVREFESVPRRRQPASAVAQLVETSATPQATSRAFSTAVGWFAGCTEDRTQLLSTWRVGGVGDQALLFVLRDWNRPVTTVVAGVARTGQVLTATTTSIQDAERVNARRSARLLASAVDGVCSLPDAGPCSGAVEVRRSRPVPTGPEPAMLSVVDLPPVSRVARPWAGTEPRRARVNLAATRCDETEFSGPGWSNNLTRTFLIPGARLPAEFGLTQTVGSLPLRRARAFVQGVRGELAACARDDLVADVTTVLDRRSPAEDIAVWNVTIEVSDERSVRYLMAVVRTGTSVSQVGFVPAAGVQMSQRDFVALAERARERLRELPAPRR
ncbi:hypothetical protein [Nocardioides dongkuii]|uniref:hypothetical protein n=1 Tax=Nocardioides dongkuii TaxID=2760089 RepID=UPI0015FDA3F7|nr:hypothetical protein [Nocardioides dongkuii]